MLSLDFGGVISPTRRTPPQIAFVRNKDNFRQLHGHTLVKADQWCRATGARGVQAAAATAAAAIPQPGQENQPTQEAKQAAFGNYTSKEYVEPVLCEVQGTLPTWLVGDVFTNGPGTGKGMGHLFSGFGMIKKLHLEGSKAFFQSRFIESDSYKAWKQTGRLAYSEFGTNANLLTDIANILKFALGKGSAFTDNSNVSVIKVPGEDQVLALGEPSNSSFIINTKDLSTVRRVDYESDKIGVAMQTAHGKQLPDGTYLNVMTSPIGKTFYLVTRQRNPMDRRFIVAQVASQLQGRPGYIHEMACTQDFVLINDSPLVLGASRNDINNYAFLQWAEGLTYGKMTLIDLNAGIQDTYKVPPAVQFHIANSYETVEQYSIEGNLYSVAFFIFESPTFDGPKSVNDMFLDNLRSPNKSFDTCRMLRYKLPIGFNTLPGKVQARLEKEFAPNSDVIIEEAVPQEELYSYELCNVSPKVRFQKHQYVYGAGIVKPTSSYHNACIKLDVQEGTVAGVWREQGMVATEPIFVPAPDGQDEDDGVVLVYAYMGDGSQILAVLDGKSMSEVARVKLPSTFNHSFHSCFCPAE